MSYFFLPNLKLRFMIACNNICPVSTIWQIINLCRCSYFTSNIDNVHYITVS